jgi:hypothetical protein
MGMSVAFDIETGPEPLERLKELCPPWEQPPHPGKFDAATVKIGNLKDAAKIAEKIHAAQASHEAAVANYERTCKEGGAGHFQAFVDDAALSSLTGRVLAIGFKPPRESVKVRHVDESGGEANLLARFWMLTELAIKTKESMVGHNIFHFDLPFLLHRSWMLGVEAPEAVFDGKYWHRCFVDTMKRWQCGDYSVKYISLNKLAKAFGLAGKLDEGGVSGAEFSRFYWGTDDERKLALAYLVRDVEITAAVAARMGVI